MIEEAMRRIAARGDARNKIDLARARALGLLQGLVEYNLLPFRHQAVAQEIIDQYNEALKEWMAA